MAPACAANIRECPSSTMAMARMRRACLASAVRAASARNCEILRSWRAISIADMLPTPRINDVLHRVTFAAGWESPRSQVLGRLVLHREEVQIRILKSLAATRFDPLVLRNFMNYFQ